MLYAGKYAGFRAGTQVRGIFRNRSLELLRYRKPGCKPGIWRELIPAGYGEDDED